MPVLQSQWPEDWDVEFLGDVCDIQIGRTPPRDNPNYWGGSNIWISIADMTDRILIDSKEKISDLAIQDNHARLVQKGSLLMSFKLTIGKLGFAGKDLYTNEAIAAFNIKDAFSKRLTLDYLYWALQAIPLEKDVTLAVKGKTLNKKKMSVIALPIPDITTQRRIVTRIEALFAELHEMQELQGQLVKDINRLRESVLAQTYKELATQYGLTETSQVCTSITDGNHMTPQYVDSGVPFLFVKHIVNRFLDFQDTKFVTQEYYDGLTDTRKPERGDVLYSVVGSYGVPVLVDTDQPFCFQRHIGILKPDRNVIVPDFLRWMLDAPQVLEQAHKVVTGSAQKTLTLTYLRKLKFPFPRSKPVQQKVANQLDEVYSEILDMKESSKRDTNLLAQMEQAILAQAFQEEL